ncbi:MAG: hypothetical protein ISS80_02715 [Candidatus Cloacimonetes bacterium]|nr:hypothetical protein [Candidatus Cloacimonadota bacterium]MBL7148963.1 hypothetical protein [Candidatus Cloacimonadota bacterium]
MKVKVITILTLFIITILATNLNAEEQSSRVMTGITAIPSFWGPGLGLRSWNSPTFGWGLTALPSWDFNDISARARLMYGFHTGTKTRWYLLASGGYMAVNEKVDIGYGSEMKYSVSMPTFVFGLGFEKLMGFKKNKGLSFEAGYQIGSAKYEIEYEYMGIQETYEATFDVSPVYIGASFSFYFK